MTTLKNRWRGALHDWKWWACVLGLLTAFLVYTPPAHAAKMFVTWVAPTKNTDGSPLTDLAGYRVEWGSCSAPNVFGTFQAGVNVAATVTRTAIYPTNLAVVCAHVFAINSKNVLSAPSNTGSGTPPPTLSKPVH